MKPIRLSGAARFEINEAAVFYEDRQPGMGRQWRLEVARVIDEVQRQPNIGRRTAYGPRQHHLNRFPFYVVFVERTENILIVSFAHERRKPGHWRDRL